MIIPREHHGSHLEARLRDEGLSLSALVLRALTALLFRRVATLWMTTIAIVPAPTAAGAG